MNTKVLSAYRLKPKLRFMFQVPDAAREHTSKGPLWPCKRYETPEGPMWAVERNGTNGDLVHIYSEEGLITSFRSDKEMYYFGELLTYEPPLNEFFSTTEEQVYRCLSIPHIVCDVGRLFLVQDLTGKYTTREGVYLDEEEVVRAEDWGISLFQKYISARSAVDKRLKKILGRYSSQLYEVREELKKTAIYQGNQGTLETFLDSFEMMFAEGFFEVKTCH